MQTVNPTLAAEWHHGKNNGLTPADVTPNSHKTVWWKCNEGHEWQAIIGNRLKGNGCPYCAGQKVLKGTNDLQTVNPILANEWNYERNNGLTPVDAAVASQSNTQDLPEYANLKQDYFGILCHVLLKKKITTSIEQFIEKVD